jgi:hypothetical protein
MSSFSLRRALERGPLLRRVLPETLWDPDSEAASGTAGIGRDQLGESTFVEFRRDSLGQAEMELADRFWVLSGDFDERAAAEHEFTAPRMRDVDRAKAARHQVLFEEL